MSEPSGRAVARELFADFLERFETGQATAGDFDDLCSRHPQLATRLRSMYAAWQGLEEAFDGVAAGPSDVPAAAAAAAAEQSAPAAREHEVRYRPRRPIATGGMGVVDCVFDAELGREVARKTLLVPAGEQPDPRLLGRFLEEARITAQLEHPGIVPVHDIGLHDDGRPFFTMTLVRGESFATALRSLRAGDGAWDRNRALGVLIRVCEAVAFAHARGVVHRDLKPGNVLVGGFGEVYVVDWGLAVSDGEAQEGVHASLRREAASSDDSALLTRDGDVLGTPAYMSPEQASAVRGSVGPQSDVYSIGAMLYELLAGRPPYGDVDRSTDFRTALAALRQGPPKTLESGSGPPELLAIQERAMARDPANRYATAEALRDDLIAFRDLRVVRAYRTGALAELRGWVRRNRAITIVAMLALAGLVVALVRIDDARRAARSEAVAATIAREAARQEAVSATAGFGTAAESVERLLTRVGIDVLRDVPHATEVRRQLLDDALDLQQRMLELRPGDPEVRRRIARARNHAAHVLVETGELEEAQRLYRQAIDELRGLLDEPPPDPYPHQLPWSSVLWTDLLANYVSLASDLEARRESTAALAVFEEVAAELGELRERDTSELFQRRVANYELARASTLEKLGRVEDAETSYRSAIEILSRYDSEAASARETRLRLAYARTRFGSMLMRRDDDVAAAEQLGLARTLHEQLLATEQQPSAELLGQAQVAARFQAAMLLDRGERSAAMPPLRASAELAAELARDFPAVSRHQLEAGLALGRLGEELTRAGQLDAGCTALDQSLAACRRYVSALPDATIGRRLYCQVQGVRVRIALRQRSWPTVERLARERLELGQNAVRRAGGAHQLLRLAAAARSVGGVGPEVLERWRLEALDGVVAQAEGLAAEELEALRKWLGHSDFDPIRSEPRFQAAFGTLR